MSKDIHDLTDNSRDIWEALNPEFDSPPTVEDLAYIRAVVKVHYAIVAERLAKGLPVRFDDCGTYTLKLRKGREVSDFKGGRFEIPDFFEVRFNAAPFLETIIQEGLTPPAPDVK